MTVGSITIPSYSQGSDLDFSQLSQLPQVWRQAQRDALTLANIDKLRAKAWMPQGDIAASLSNTRAAIAARSGIPDAVSERLRIWGIDPARS